MPGRLDFIIIQGKIVAGIEVKNVRPWIYPDSSKYLFDLLKKCCAISAVPVLIARRIHYSTFSVLSRCGVIIHQTFNQLYPYSEAALASKARQKDLLGYHDIRIGNQPDDRLIKFLHTNLPALLPSFHGRFEQFRDLLCAYSSGNLPYAEFAGRSKRRACGEPEDLPEFEQPDD